MKWSRPEGTFQLQYFEESARSLIADALELAQRCQAIEVRPEHLLVCASKDGLEQTALREFRSRVEQELPRSGSAITPPEFSREVLALFERAYRASDGTVQEIHLLMCLDVKCMATANQGPRLRDMLEWQLVSRTLDARGVNVPLLLSEIGDLDLLAVQPDPDFWMTVTGRRILDLAPNCVRPGAAVFSLLLALLLRRGPVGAGISRSGLTEPMLIEILAGLGGPAPEVREQVYRHLSSADLGSPDCLGQMEERLSEAAKVAVAMGWNCAHRKQVGGQNLLDGLLYADILCQPGRGATAVLRKLDVLGFVHSAMKSMVRMFDDTEGPAVPQLSQEVRQAVEYAIKVAGQAPVSTEHLLYGLAAVELNELRAVGLTAEQILPLLVS
ncbi:hypothetical protein IV102_26605 [bacterium]|nr:hypothetical protein [bacterium]